MWEGEDDLMDKDRTPKQRLLEWVQNKIPDRPIRNFTTDWNDGTNIGALVDSCAPGEYRAWDKKNSDSSSRESLGLSIANEISGSSVELVRGNPRRTFYPINMVFMQPTEYISIFEEVHNSISPGWKKQCPHSKPRSWLETGKWYPSQ